MENCSNHILYRWYHIKYIVMLFGKELSDAELRDGKEEEDSKLTLAETFKLLISNKYFVMICVVYILQQLRAAMLSVGTTL